MHFLKYIGATHFLIGINILMLGLSIWSVAKPSKSWQVSKSSETRFIASESNQVHEESFDEMASLDFNCEKAKINTTARYVRIKLSPCSEDGNHQWKIHNTVTGSSATVLSNTEFETTDYIFLEKGLNPISLKYKGKSGQELQFALSLVVEAPSNIQ